VKLLPRQLELSWMLAIWLVVSWEMGPDFSLFRVHFALTSRRLEKLPISPPQAKGKPVFAAVFAPVFAMVIAP
jgi:hypothetical protein